MSLTPSQVFQRIFYSLMEMKINRRQEINLFQSLSSCSCGMKQLPYFFPGICSAKIDRWLIYFSPLHSQLIPLMFCERWSFQRTWRGCPWRPASAPAGGALMRRTWLTTSKRSSSAHPLNSYSPVLAWYFPKRPHTEYPFIPLEQ